MIFLDDMRMPIKRHTKYFKKHLQPLEDKEWCCPTCDQIIPGSDNDLIYFGEQDFVGHKHDTDDFPLTFPPFNLPQKCGVCAFVGEMPKQIEKLIQNTYIKTGSNVDQIKARDNFQCQICGFDDRRALEVHHIVPRSSPFVIKSFIRSPLNCITLCANCHRINQYILRYGEDWEREQSVKEMGDLNGWNMKWFDSMFYESHQIFKEYKDIKFL